MKIAGKNIYFGDTLTNTQKNYIQQRVSALARHLHGKGYNVEMKTSLSTDSVYLEVNKKIISFRNHPGTGDYYSVVISSFPNWMEIKRHVLTSILPKLPTPKKLTHDFFEVDLTNQFTEVKEDTRQKEVKAIETEAIELRTEVMEYIGNIERNIERFHNSIKKLPKNDKSHGQINHMVNLLRNTNKTIVKMKQTVK